MKHSETIPRHLLDGLEAFVRVAEHRSFRSAADELGMSPSALSQKIRALEDRAGVALLTRTTRSVGLTQAGEIFLSRAKPAFVDIASAYNEARNLGQPAGLLRLHMPYGVLPFLIEPILAGFCAAYPRIQLEIHAEDQSTDLIEGGFDAGVRLGEFLERDMIALRLTPPLRFIVAGSPAYFERHGRPERPADLRHHNCVRTRLGGGKADHWAFVQGGRPLDIAVTGQVITNSYDLNVKAAINGVGVSYISEALVGALLGSGDLEAVLTHFMPTSAGIFLYYPSRSQVLPKLRVFIDYLQTHKPFGGISA